MRPVKLNPTHITGLDILLNGGLPERSVSIVGGTPGSGKTIFATAFLVGGILEADEAGVFVSFEESPERIRRSMVGFGWDIETWEAEGKWAFVDASPRPDESTISRSGPFDLSGFVARIERAVKKTGAKRVVLDSLTAILGRFDDPSIVRFEMFRVSEALRELGITSFITAERLEESSDQPRFGVEDFVADNVIILRNRLDVEKRRRTIEVLKMRGADHHKGEHPFTITPTRGLTTLPIVGMGLGQFSSDERVSSGVTGLDRMLGGGIFEGSSSLVSGATGCGKTLITAHFAGATKPDERCVLFGFEESRDQLVRNAKSWGIDFPTLEEQNRLRIVARYPESNGIERHLQLIQDEVEEFQPHRVVIDSLSALERVSSKKSFREFVVALTGLLKQRQTTSLLTLTTGTLMGGASVTEGHISSIADCIVLLRYVEIAAEVHRGVTVLKMRGSRHEKQINEFNIDDRGMTVGEPFRNISGILAGRPVYGDLDDRIDDILG